MEKRNSLIDGIRGFAILAVILLHCNIHMPFDVAANANKWLSILLRSGYYGVMVFFVVSGFLITSTAIKKWGSLQSIELSQFYLMRFARIMPCLGGLLIIISILSLLQINGFIVHTTTLQQALFSALTFSINWLEAKTGYLPANWDVLWSLSVEEVFYLFFPVLCLVFRKQKQLIFLMLIFIVTGPFARITFSDNEFWSDHSYLSCMDGIAMGCLAAIYATSHPYKIGLNRFLAIVGIILFGFVFFCRKQTFDIGMTSLGLNVTILEAGIALILIAIHHISYTSTWLRPIQWFGKNSYEVYLTHSFLVMIFSYHLYLTNQPTWIIVIEYMAVVIGSGLLGHVIARYYSQPLNHLIRARRSGREVSYSPG